MENELADWIKENLGDETKIQVIIPQFKRIEKLEYNWKPVSPDQFKAVIDKAPFKILFGLGFRKWDTINNLIKENSGKPEHDLCEIPIINSNEKLFIDLGRKKCPTEPLPIDEDIILFPGEWYDVIPDGLTVTGLNGEPVTFKKGESDDDIRFGCLPYGIKRQIQ